MSRYYVKAKNYVIRPSKKEEVLNLINANFKGSKYQNAMNRVLANKPMTFRRWAYYFDFNYLNEILMEENCVEVQVDENTETNNIDKNYLGI